VRLVTLRFVPRGVYGWASPELLIANRTTSILAPNGSGKTPLVQAIAFCLGYPVTFREDINEKCAAAILVVVVGAEAISIRRAIGRDFNVTATFHDGSVREFFSEQDYSGALFDILGMASPILVSTSKEPTHPYISTFLPLFYLNQDNGYAEAYRAPRAFITDQFVEMARFAFGLAPKHSFEVKKDLLSAKDALEAVNRKIVYQQKVIADLTSTTDGQGTLESLDLQGKDLQQRLSQLRESVNAHGNANSALSDLLATKDESIRATKRTIDDLSGRVRGIESIRSEIDSEIQTLALNEESKRIFESFAEICRNPQCGLFVGSSESYAKNLLYLKDQLKDLQRNADRASVRLVHMQESLGQQMAERSELALKLSVPGAGSGVDQLVSALQQVTMALFTTEQRRTAVIILEKERAKYFGLEGERESIQNRIANLTSVGRSDLEFNRLRLGLRELIVKWLDILETRNVKRDVEIDLEFRFKFGGEPLEAIAGSTKIRVVLAIHAALLELYLQDETRPFRFLILDTPKQHEMHTRDLAEFLTRLSELCGRSNAQLVFSSTEYRFPVDGQDVEWVPSYPGQRQPMYLGAASQ
jgi:hypothetical protein